MIKIKQELKNNRTGEAIPEFKTEVEITLSETHLTFEFLCKNSRFFSAGDKYNDSIYNGDVCEAFISVDGGINNYFEVEVAPNNTVFLYRIQNSCDGVFKGEPIPESENFVESSVELLGSDYKVNFSLPLDKMGYDEGKGLLLNAFRIETEGGHTDLNLLALSPTLCDTFHKSEAFIKLKK